MQIKAVEKLKVGEKGRDTVLLKKMTAVPDTVKDWALCTIIHLLLQKKSSLPSSFLFSTMSDIWWDVWHMGHSRGVLMFCKVIKTMRNTMQDQHIDI